MFLGAAARSVVIVWLPSAVIDTVVCIPYRGFCRGVLQGLLRGNNRSLDLPTRGDIFAYATLSTFADCQYPSDCHRYLGTPETTSPALIQMVVYVANTLKWLRFRSVNDEA